MAPAASRAQGLIYLTTQRAEQHQGIEIDVRVEQRDPQRHRQHALGPHPPAESANPSPTAPGAEQERPPNQLRNSTPPQVSSAMPRGWRPADWLRQIFLKAMLAMGSITIPRRMLMGVYPPQLGNRATKWLQAVQTIVMRRQGGASAVFGQGDCARGL